MTPGVVTLAALGAVATLVALGCSRPSGSDPGSGPSASASAPSTTVAAATPSGAPAAPPRATTVTWTGTYTSTPGSLFVRDGGEWRGVRFRGDDASVGLGEGPLSLTVDTKTGRLTGSGSGPIGDVVLSGAVVGETLTFTVTRKDARDCGLSGTGVGHVDGDSLRGTLRLSQGDARVIREAAFSLARKAP